MQDFVGKKIDRYHITERLGMGGMAVVYKAYDTRLERDVALKLIRSEAIPEEQHDHLMKRFEREAKAQARFNHRHIVPVYDYGEVDGSPYLVMAYIPGGTLKERTGQPIPYQQGIRWLIPVADALTYAHHRGVIHRDIKPSNILFDDEDQPTLTDFGIAKILETDEATLTGTGLGVGTPEYMAPEQWQGKATDATDQYALGVVLYELLTGKKPYQADTPAAVAIMQATEPLPSPRVLAQGIPEAVEKLLYKALARDTFDRYEDMNFFRAALENQLELDKSDPKKPQAFTQSASSSPIPKPAQVSEEETVDLLEVTPLERISLPAEISTGADTDKGNKKAVLPIYLLLTGAGAIVLIALVAGVLLLIRGRTRPPSAVLVPTTTAVIEASIAISTSTLTQEITATETPLPSPTAVLNPVLGSMMVNPADGALMVYAPEGLFRMGSEIWESWDNEKPEHSVFLDAFWIYQHEVTNAAYRQCVEAGGCTKPENSSYFETRTYDNHPVVYVNWFDANAYCQWAGGRLPTEAEWEKAARGTDGLKYPWGSKTPTCNVANFAGCVGENTSVGSYLDGASPYGTLDMAGNVWEWVQDWYDKDYYSVSAFENPTGPITGTDRVLRGGSLYNQSRSLRTTYRFKSNPDISGISYGFRCVYNAEP